LSRAAETTVSTETSTAKTSVTALASNDPLAPTGPGGFFMKGTVGRGSRASTSPPREAATDRDQALSEVSAFAAMLLTLHAQRKNRVAAGRDNCIRRARLSTADRGEVRSKTGGRCHICGGPIDADDWEADHILARSSGGEHSAENYLPAHPICNNYRWHYGAEEFQWILKIGVWMRTQIEKETPVGREAGQQFCTHEVRRSERRKSNSARRSIE
jgi:hypothetical protein